MTPEKQALLKTHLDAMWRSHSPSGIAEMLYQESEPGTMETLEDIELTVREQIQTHVSPELGVFYPRSYRK